MMKSFALYDDLMMELIERSCSWSVLRLDVHRRNPAPYP
jgi:hypothetical protein